MAPLVPAAVVATAMALAACGGGGGHHPSGGPASGQGSASAQQQAAKPTRARPVRHAKPVVGLRVLRLVDTSRTITLPDGTTAPRTLVTYVRYPALASATSRGGDAANAPPAHAGAPYPLVVFGHGFAVTPAIYALLLRAWARVGFVVAAPVFPLGNANAPGGPNESDLPNQPADMSFVITRLLAGAPARVRWLG